MDFMDQRIQPLLVEAGKTSIDAKVGRNSAFRSIDFMILIQ